MTLAALLLIASFLSLPQVADYGGFWALLQKWCGTFDLWFLFPAMLAAGLVFLGYLILEWKKDAGRRMFSLSWSSLIILLALAVSVYPLLAAERKCHGFFDGLRKQWVGYTENLTLDGLEYLPRETPYDAAAIRFLNDHVPDQPCLMEFVGEGYNSWGSRFSIFTGIPGLMGWDGHVHEWVTGQPKLGEDVDQRRRANELIFNTTDTALAKKYLDAYGVRLVMVGTVERHGVPGRKGGYPAEGLAKFPSFLPLIYKNPEVEIYYNPPSAN
jgi:uncharacterized membrane protein